MILTDPARPQVANRPGLIGTLGIVPDLHLMPRTAELTEVRVMLAVESNSYSWYTTVLINSDIPQLLKNYYLDPEVTLQNTFHWLKPTRQAPLRSNLPNLEELDL